MELPKKIKRLYRHWPSHTEYRKKLQELNKIIKNEALTKQISFFINERIKIWKKKTLRTNPPYTKDSVLSKYRFCNIYREFDRQTIEFHTLLNPVRDNFP